MKRKDPVAVVGDDDNWQEELLGMKARGPRAERARARKLAKRAVDEWVYARPPRATLDELFHRTECALGLKADRALMTRGVVYVGGKEVGVNPEEFVKLVHLANCGDQQAAEKLRTLGR